MLNFYYHKDLKINAGVCEETFQSFRQKYKDQTGLLTNHYHIRYETKYQDVSDSESERWRGRLIQPRILNTLVALGQSVTPIDTILPDKPGILILYWPSIHNMDKTVLDTIFGDYTGSILIDDTYETHLTRDAVTLEWLEDMGYDLSNVSIWANGPNKDNVIDYDSKLIRQNWIHLVHTYETRKPIPRIEDKASLKSLKNKLKKFLYMNGHSTAQREYIYGALTSQEDLFDYWHSFRSTNSSKDIYFLLKNKDRDKWTDKHLPADVEGLATARDNFTNESWWTRTYYNINVETNFHWRDHNARLLTEKWMKPIMYLTPSFNIGDYPGLEEFTKLLGFETYDNLLNKQYDLIDNWYSRGDSFAKCILECVRPTTSEWERMMEKAEYNHNHFYTNYLPLLENTLLESIQILVDKS